MLQIPPSQLDGRNIGGLTRRMRRAGRVACLHAAALFLSNDAARAAMESRSDERSSRARTQRERIRFVRQPKILSI